MDQNQQRGLHVSILEVFMLLVIAVATVCLFNLGTISTRLSQSSSANVSLDGTLKTNLGSVTGKVDQLHNAAAYITVLFWSLLGMVFYMFVSLLGAGYHALKHDVNAARYSYPNAQARQEAVAKQLTARIVRAIEVILCSIVSAFALLMLAPIAVFYMGAAISSSSVVTGLGYGAYSAVVMLGVLTIVWSSLKIVFPKINQVI